MKEESADDNDELISKIKYERTSKIVSDIEGNGRDNLERKSS